MNDSSMERTLKNVAKLLGLFLLAISVYLSYDGFDQGVTGGNTTYSNLAKLIGVVLAVTISVIQFIFSSRYEQLNTTLKGVGVVAYVYSIWTNYLGAKHLLQMDDTTAVITALAMDIVPEPMIAWGLGDAMKGDMLGNIGKWVSGYQPKPQQSQQNNNNHQGGQKDKSDGQYQESKKGMERRKELEKMYMGQDRRGVGGKEHHRMEIHHNGDKKPNFE